jgi:secreted Zn-dependent insulinase-like peptidase
MVHLGSAQFPDEKEYKAFLAQHGGTSNASTSEQQSKAKYLSSDKLGLRG